MLQYPKIRQAAFALSLVVGASLASGCHVQFRSTTGTGGQVPPPSGQTRPASPPINRPVERPAPITAAPAAAPVAAPAPAPQGPAVVAAPAAATPPPAPPAAPPVSPTVSRRPMAVPAPTPTVTPSPIPTSAPRQVQAPSPDEPTPMPGRGRQVAPPSNDKVPPGLAKKQPAMPPGLAKKRGAAIDSADIEPDRDNGRFTADPKNGKAKGLK